MKRKWLLLCFLLFLFAGCSLKDLDKRFFVVSMGIDALEEGTKKYRVSLKLAIPSPKIVPGKENFQIITEDANSIAEAVRNAKSKVDKELDFAHAKVFVLDEDIPKADMLDIIDWFTRRRDIQEISWLTIGRPSAYDVLKVKPKSERLPSNALFLTFGREGTESPYIITTYLFDFYRRLHEKGLDPYMPVTEARKGYFLIDKVALFDKKGIKLVLNRHDTRILNELMTSFEKFSIKVKDGGLLYYINIENLKITYDLQDRKNGSGLDIMITANLTGIVEEAQKNISPDAIPHLEKLAAKEMDGRLSKVLKQLQQQELDPIGFGERYLASHYNKDEDWKKWKELYPKAVFRIQTQVKLESSGTIK
ncbi:Ger(x)C family spore germination protein [Ectobacillus ponti]|uniref:Ger(X)C family spore germination protein n=1 Tax=Ectobacillus ponti TaxID=2961894 RepID=A0AA41X5J9_9BACI|nr:Ger(x)C family spore germination protein [Ectobacillus ponti]MCP8967250.1 Ger(x)C family spore germination protein [Ectobacillus ponti]